MIIRHRSAFFDIKNARLPYSKRTRYKYIEKSLAFSLFKGRRIEICRQKMSRSLSQDCGTQYSYIYYMFGT